MGMVESWGTRRARTISCAVVCSVICAGGFVRAVPAQQADYSDAAERYRAAHALEALPADTSALESALDQAFARLDLGLFEVCYPWGPLADAKHADELRDLLLGILDLQFRARAWLDPQVAEPAPPADAAAVRSWIKAWRGEPLKKAVLARATDAPLTAVANADAKQLAALESMKESFRSGAAFGVVAKGGGSTDGAARLVLAPTRDEFIGAVAWIGSLSDAWKPILWSNNLPQRIEARVNDLQILALTSPAADSNGLGVPMDTREKTGLFQHVTQYAADHVIKHLFGSTLDAGLHSGLAVDLVLDLYGENNARLFGSGEGKTIPARERFVPGGRSSGGKLSARSADSRWRTEKGADHFIKQLKIAQTEGGKAAMKLGESEPSPFAHFILDEREKPQVKDVAHAPVLGTFAASQQIPENFFADYQEFLRAYRAAFLHWLSTEAMTVAGDKRGAAKLLRGRIEKPEATLDALATEVFGVPLTSTDPSSKALEWQFLSWLAKVHI